MLRCDSDVLDGLEGNCTERALTVTLLTRSQAN